MDTRKVAQAGMNVYGCPERKCEGTGFVPVTLGTLAEIRVLGTERKERIEFTCKHFHTVFLRCGHMHTISGRK